MEETEEKEMKRSFKRTPKQPVCLRCGRRDSMEKMRQIRFDGPTNGPVFEHIECPKSAG